MNFELSHNSREIPDTAILNDMRRVAGIIESTVLRQRDYREHGRFGVTTAIRRFGSWAVAIKRADLEKSVDRQIADIQLFENLLSVWTAVGKQPSYSVVHKPLSKYHVTTYERRFGSWRLALEAFCSWANEAEIGAPSNKSCNSPPNRRKTLRQPDLRLRFRILSRDRFTCCACGLSPATTPGTELEVDHIMPWSKGGETVEENLQTLCRSCNQGKSDIMIEND